MGGQEGNRGYLVQTVIAVLNSLNDLTWESVTLEPNPASDKVDILWAGQSGRKAVQVKSSINPINMPNAKAWAGELKAASTADTYGLILVGPCSHGVAKMGNYGGVSIPCPKNLDFSGLLNEAAHLLDKFLVNEGFGQKSPHQRELMAQALVTQLSVMATEGSAFSRVELISLLKQWVGAVNGPSNAAWERETFENQRGIESAVAGQRLGPADVDACPSFSISREIIKELDRSHIYELVGVPGCGKSITAWQAAKHYRQLGFSVWRPRAFADSTELLSNLPMTQQQMLVVDDAQRFGPPFATRLAELASSKLKVLLVSTVEQAQLTTLICIHPGKCVDELLAELLVRRDELLPLLRKYDDRIGDRPFDISIENRLYDSGRQPTPWAFFWILRGGWSTAKREFESLSQFPYDGDLLLLIAAGQVVSCDAGVSRAWLIEQASTLRVPITEVEVSLKRLARLTLIVQGDELRTKHIQYAYQLIELVFHKKNRDAWPHLVTRIIEILMDGSHSLKGTSWLLDAFRQSDAFRWRNREHFNPLVEHLIARCTTEYGDDEWAAGCLSRVFGNFEVPPEEILKQRKLLLRWVTAGSGLISYFCSNIVNILINGSRPEDPGRMDFAKQFNEDIDVARLVELANHLHVDEFHSYGSLLNRLAFYGPSWADRFISELDWSRLKDIILYADVDRAYAVDKVVYCITRLAETAAQGTGLGYIQDILPYLINAIVTVHTSIEVVLP